MIVTERRAGGVARVGGVGHRAARAGACRRAGARPAAAAVVVGELRRAATAAAEEAGATPAATASRKIVVAVLAGSAAADVPRMYSAADARRGAAGPRGTARLHVLRGSGGSGLTVLAVADRGAATCTALGPAARPATAAGQDEPRQHRPSSAADAGFAAAAAGCLALGRGARVSTRTSAVEAATAADSVVGVTAVAGDVDEQRLPRLDGDVRADHGAEAAQSGVVRAHAAHATDRDHVDARDPVRDHEGQVRARRGELRDGHGLDVGLGVGLPDDAGKTERGENRRHAGTDVPSWTYAPP